VPRIEANRNPILLDTNVLAYEAEISCSYQEEISIKAILNPRAKVMIKRWYWSTAKIKPDKTSANRKSFGAGLIFQYLKRKDFFKEYRRKIGK
jgi:hypothetical protein